MSITMGDTAGERATLALTNTRLKVPSINPQSPTVTLPMDFTCLGSTGEDETTLIFD